MNEATHLRKHRIALNEYDYTKDIENRVLMSQFSTVDIEVLEEILYSPLRIPFSILKKNTKLSQEKLISVLEKLAETKLFTLYSDYLAVDKETRKYFEFEVLKFEENFKPGMEYLQALLRKVPIHILPTWYSIPRTSDNIFESIIEKHLITPQVFQRYLMELHLTDPIQNGIMNAVYKSPDYQINAKDMMEKFEISQQQFEEHMLQLEFHFVCCTKYVKKGKYYVEIITLFDEWREYLCKVRDTEPNSIIDEETIVRDKPKDFSVIEEMNALLKGKIHLSEYETHAKKLCNLGIAKYSQQKLTLTEEGKNWLSLPIVEQAIFIYRHPKRCLDHSIIHGELMTNRVLREAEKAVHRIVNAGWVYLDEFLKGIFIPLREEQEIKLKRVGRSWKYELPKYSKVELEFFRSIIKEWLFEVGITATGTKDGKEVFCLTEFGKNFYDNE